MKDFSYIKEKKERERRVSRSISLPNSLWATYEQIAEENNLNISDIIEEAMKRFCAHSQHENDLEGYAEMQQEAYQMGASV